MNYADCAVYEFASTDSDQMDRSTGRFNEHRVFTSKDTAIVTPDSDTPYSMLWVDLRAEPIVLSVPAVSKDRYYSAQLIDGNTYHYGYVGRRATGTAPGNYLIVQPDLKGQTPAGIKKVFQSTTYFGLTPFRTQLFNAKDMPNVEKVHAGYRAQTLSAYLHQPPPPAAPAIDFPKADADLVESNFFEFLDFALQFNPATPTRRISVPNWRVLASVPAKSLR